MCASFGDIWMFLFSHITNEYRSPGISIFHHQRKKDQPKSPYGSECLRELACRWPCAMFKLMKVPVLALSLPHGSKHTLSLLPAMTCKFPKDLTSLVWPRELAERREAVIEEDPWTAIASWLLFSCQHTRKHKTFLEKTSGNQTFTSYKKKQKTFDPSTCKKWNVKRQHLPFAYSISRQWGSSPFPAVWGVRLSQWADAALNIGLHNDLAAQKININLWAFFSIYRRIFHLLTSETVMLIWCASYSLLACKDKVTRHKQEPLRYVRHNRSRGGKTAWIWAKKADSLTASDWSQNKSIAFSSKVGLVQPS